MPIDRALLDILVCPVSRAPLVETGDWLVSTDPDTRYRYPIRDGIPVLLADEAEALPEDVWREVVGD